MTQEKPPAKLSVLTDDPELARIARRSDLVVRLGGEKITHVIAYDTEAGWVDHYLVPIRSVRGETARTRTRGVVTVAFEPKKDDG